MHIRGYCIPPRVGVTGCKLPDVGARFVVSIVEQSLL